MAPVTINGNTLDLDAKLHPPDMFPSDASGSNYVLLQFNYAPTGEEFDHLAKLGAKVLSREGDRTLLCRYEPADLGVLQALKFVEHAVVYHAHFVIQRHSWHHVDKLPGPTALINIVLHNECGETPEDICRTIQASVDPGVKLVHSSTDQLQIQTTRAALGGIAALDSVRSLHPALQPSPYSTQACAVIGLAPDSMHKDHFEKYSGEDEVVAVADTGFDLGEINAKTHVAFKDPLNNGIRGMRVVPPKSVFARHTGLKPGDPFKPLEVWDIVGHGTAVASCVNGRYNDALISKNAIKLMEKTAGGKRNAGLLGTAPCATVFPIKYLSDNTKKVKDTNNLRVVSMEDMLKLPYDDINNLTAKIYNLSWGSVGDEKDKGRYYEAAGYTDDVAGPADKAMLSDDELLIVFAGGNNGDTPTTEAGAVNLRGRQIAYESSSKNPLCVGHTFNTRMFLEAPGRSYGDPQWNQNAIDETECLDGKTVSQTKPAPKAAIQSATRVSYKSNRGPTLENRIKPDVVAPGAGILAARTLKAKDPEEYGTSPHPTFIFQSGTSFSAPLVSGVAASLRSALKSNKQVGARVDKPSGVLVKALIINGAVDLEGSYYEWCDTQQTPGSTPGKPDYTIQWRVERMPAAPNGAQGWGLVNMERSLVPLSTEGGFKTDDVARGGNKQYDILAPTSANDGSQRVLTVTLCYNDAVKALIQDKLSFQVEGHPKTLNEIQALNLTPPVTSVPPVPPKEAAHSPGVDLPSDTVKGQFSWNNVQRWTCTCAPVLFNNFRLTVSNDATSVGATTKFAVVWAFTTS